MFRAFNSSRIEFESLLDRKLQTDYLKFEVNSKTGRAAAESILAQRPELKAGLKLINFGDSFFSGFFKRYGWRWNSKSYSKDEASVPELKIEYISPND